MNAHLIFLKADNTIAQTYTMTAPKTGEPLKYYFSNVPVKYAIELTAGSAKKLNLQKGQKIDFPQRIYNIIPEPD